MFCRGHDFAKNSKCCTQNRLGAPFVTYEFAWGRILNRYAVISSDKQNNDRKVSDCLTLTRSLFVLLTTLKQCIHLKSDHVSHSHLLISQIKHYGRTWSERLRLLLQSFFKLQSFLYNNYDGNFVYLQKLRECFETY